MIHVKGSEKERLSIVPRIVRLPCGSIDMVMVSKHGSSLQSLQEVCIHMPSILGDIGE